MTSTASGFTAEGSAVADVVRLTCPSCERPRGQGHAVTCDLSRELQELFMQAASLDIRRSDPEAWQRAIRGDA